MRRLFNYKTWLSSDYFQEQLKYDPDVTHKKLGDGFYEQKLVNEQVMAITGQKYLGTYQDAQAQYQGLMENAVKFGQSSGAQLGVALTATQLQNLKQDIVWLVEKEVLLPDGKIVKALVPQVYLQADSSKGAQGNAVIGAQEIDFKVVNEILNQGTIVAKDKLQLAATNINNNGGKIQGSEIAIKAVEDFNNRGGKILATQQITLEAGGDVNLESTVNEQRNAQGQVRNIASVSSVEVAANNGKLQIKAGRDLNLKASNVQSAGSADLTAQGQVKISTVTVAEGHNLEWDANNKRQDYTSQEIGSQVVAAGNLKIKAGENLEIRASNVGSSEQLTLQAEKNVTIQAGKTQVQVQENHLNTGKSGGGSKITTRTNQSLQASESIASNLAGKNISITGQNVAVEQGQITAEQELKVQATEQIKIKAGQNSTSSSSQESSRKAGMFSKSSKDVQQTSSQQSLSASTLSGGTVQLQAQETIQIQASNVVGEQDVQLKADKGIVIEAGQEKLVSSSHTQEKKSGLFTSGLNITLGKQSNKNAYQQGETTNLGSVVGSVQGTVDIESQAAVTVQASNIKAGKDLKISGSQVNITDAQAEYSSKEQQESKQSGLSIGLGGGLVSKVQEVAQPLERATQVQDKRLQALYAYKAVDKLQDLKTADTTGRDLKLNISLGTSKSSSNSESYSQVSQGSSLQSQENLEITATAGDLTVQGSELSGKNISLKAQENIQILAGTNSNTSSSNSQSSSASIGVEVGVGGISGVNLAAVKQQGKIKENGTSYTASQITATDKLALESGKDLQVIGSQATAEQVQAKVGGNLEIASLQTKESYKEENQGASIGLSAKVKPTGNLGKGAITGGVNQGKINSDYQSVTEQAGIYAGQVGFDIQVGKNTDLKGAVIASEATAEKNKLSTGTLSYSDIDNKAEYQASSMGINVNTSGDAKYNEKGITPAIGIGAEGKAQSTTKAAIAPGTIEVRDNPNQDLSNLSRDTKGSLNQLGKIFDKKTIQERQELAKMFGELAYEQVHKLSVKELTKAKFALAVAQDKKPQDDKRIKELQAQVAAWSEGGSNKIALHSIVGGVMADLGGGNGFAGAVGAGLNEAVQDKLSKTFKNKPDLHQWASAIIGATAAKVVGGNAQTGASTAASGTKNNNLDEEILAQNGASDYEILTESNRYYIDALAEARLDKNTIIVTQPDGTITYEYKENMKLGDLIDKESLIINTATTIPDSVLSKATGIDGPVGRLNLMIVINEDSKKHSGKDFGIAVISDVAGYGAGEVFSNALKIENTVGTAMVIIYGTRVGINIGCGMLGDATGKKFREIIKDFDRRNGDK
ncbi:hemagglutinin repeat-containing protein [Succinispira mobilis]|uniref:hemagglutinin repeat-containing protein n=1 Tax=Succinispira mobilis TaxID=78120 RepID=UPI00037D8BB9|nr:hemagglutinin repeat-containing protein [Succinispira mobilis]